HTWARAQRLESAILGNELISTILADKWGLGLLPLGRTGLLSTKQRAKPCGFLCCYKLLLASFAMFGRFIGLIPGLIPTIGRAKFTLVTIKGLLAPMAFPRKSG